MNYFFLYKLTDGSIYESPYRGLAQEWTNVPSGCQVIGPIPKNNEIATEAFRYPNYYTIQNGALTPVVNIDDLRAADQAPKPAPVSEIDEVKQQIADINLVLADMMGA